MCPANIIIYLPIDHAIHKAAVMSVAGLLHNVTSHNTSTILMTNLQISPDIPRASAFNFTPAIQLQEIPEEFQGTSATPSPDLIKP